MHALDPATHSVFSPVSPSNTADLTLLTRRLFVGGAGNIYVQKADGTPVFLQGIPAGTILPIRIKRVMVNDGNATPGSVTTATNLIALF